MFCLGWSWTGSKRYCSASCASKSKVPAAAALFAKLSTLCQSVGDDTCAKHSDRLPTRRVRTGACLHGPWQPVNETGTPDSVWLRSVASFERSNPILVWQGKALHTKTRQSPCQNFSLAPSTTTQSSSTDVGIPIFLALRELEWVKFDVFTAPAT